MSILDLWLPVLASAGVVWIFSALVWMVFPWHKKDFSAVGDESAVRSALSGLRPGNYNLPHCTDQKQLQEPAMQAKFKEGPLAFITILPNGIPNMGKNLVSIFLFYIFVGVLCAYFVTRTTGPDAEYLQVFRVAGTVAWIAYGVAYVQDTIWFGRPLSATLKSLFDALLYGLLTGGVFGWLA